MCGPQPTMRSDAMQSNATHSNDKRKNRVWTARVEHIVILILEAPKLLQIIMMKGTSCVLFVSKLYVFDFAFVSSFVQDGGALAAYSR